ncbi:hypothetical protein [Psychrobacillus phage Perkons]|nr:hypothetical protein [Psychrobacillus phage Perkons]
MTVATLKEFAKYVGFNKDFGYVYDLKGTLYAYNRNGITLIEGLMV